MLALFSINIWLIAAIYDIHREIGHIQGTCNKIADLLSRPYSDKAHDVTLLKEIENTCTWHRIAMQFFNLNCYI